MARSFQPTTRGEEINPFRGDLTKEDLQKLRRTLAKRANQRLVRLERASSRITGEGYATYGAAQNAYDYLEKRDRRRFAESENVKMNKNAIRREISVLQSFLSAKSSTVLGQREIEQKRVHAFESGEWGEKWKRQGIRQEGIKFAGNKEFYDFLNSSTFKELVISGFTSEQIVEMYAQARLQDDNERVLENMQDALDNFRNKGKTSLKELRTTLGLKPLRRS